MREDRGKTKKDLAEENLGLRRRVAELEASTAGGLRGQPPWVASDWLEIAERAANIGFYNWDMLTGKLIWSEGFYKLFGLPAGARPSFETWLEVVHPEDREPAMARINESVAAQAPLVNEYRITLPDGRIRWINAVGNTFYGETGKPLRSCGVCVDITERTEAGSRLQATLERFYTILLNTYSSVLLVTNDGIVEFANELFCRFFNLHEKPAELVGLTAAEVIERIRGSFLDPGKAVARIARILARGKPVHGEEVAMAGGRTYLRDFVPICVRGKPYGRAWFHLDITERKNAEVQIRNELELRVQERTAELVASREMEQEQRREIETYYQTAPIGLCVLDTDLRYVRINERLAAWNGRPASEHIGRTIREMLPWLAAEAERVGRQVIERGEPVTNVEMKSAVPSDAGRIWTVGWYPMKDPVGTVVGISVVVEEVTKQRKLEEQLHQSRKMEAIGALAGGIAHDFNNILAAILGFTEMALEDVEDRPQVSRSLANVSKAAMRARELVKQILTFSRKTSRDRHTLSLTSITQEALGLLRASTPAAIGIKFTPAAAMDTVFAAPTEIRQILMNLATNASLAMRDKGGVIEVVLSDVDVDPDSPLVADITPGEYVRLFVKDTGVGMSADLMRRVFEPFFTTRDVGGGSGMGLAVVYGIVRDLGGTITVESEPGTGSTFSVLLPIVKAGGA